MTPTSSSRLRAEIVRLLLVYGGLALLLIGAPGQSVATSHGEVVDGALSRAGLMIAGVADPGAIIQSAPSMLATPDGTADRSGEDEDDDDAGDELAHGVSSSFHDPSGSLKVGRITGIDPARSRHFDHLPLRAPPL